LFREISTEIFECWIFKSYLKFERINNHIYKIEQHQVKHMDIETDLPGYMITGKGSLNSNGNSILVRDKESNDEYVIKIIEVQNFQTENSKNAFLKYIRDVQSFSSMFIVPLRLLKETERRIYLIRPHISSIPLNTYIVRGLQTDKNILFVIWKLIVRGYSLLEAHQIYPNPVKPSNIFINENLSIHITDLYWPPNDMSFGFRAPAMSEFAFYPPEYFSMATKLSYYSDVWSLGVLLYYIMTGDLPWEVRNPHHLVYSMISFDPSRNQKVLALPESVIAIIKDTLVADPSHRISIRSIIDSSSCSSLKSEKINKIPSFSYKINLPHSMVQRKQLIPCKANILVPRFKSVPVTKPLFNKIRTNSV